MHHNAPAEMIDVIRLRVLVPGNLMFSWIRVACNITHVVWKRDQSMAQLHTCDRQVKPTWSPIDDFPACLICREWGRGGSTGRCEWARPCSGLGR